MRFVCGQCGQLIKPVKVEQKYDDYSYSFNSKGWFEHCGKKDEFNLHVPKHFRPSDLDYTVVVCKETVEELVDRLEWV